MKWTFNAYDGNGTQWTGEGRTRWNAYKASNAPGSFLDLGRNLFAHWPRNSPRRSVEHCGRVAQFIRNDPT